MHDSVMDFGRKMITRERVEGKRILELGSRDVNGSLRSMVMAFGPSEYLGVDKVMGRGVDLVADIERLNSFAVCDGVICTEMLEHVGKWWVVLQVISRAIEKGWAIVTTRSPGFPLHAYPEDHWRFTMDDMKAILGVFEKVHLEEDGQVDHPGVFAFIEHDRGRFDYGAFYRAMGRPVYNMEAGKPVSAEEWGGPICCRMKDMI